MAQPPNKPTGDGCAFVCAILLFLIGLAFFSTWMNVQEEAMRLGAYDEGDDE